MMREMVTAAFLLGSVTTMPLDSFAAEITLTPTGGAGLNPSGEIFDNFAVGSGPESVTGTVSPTATQSATSATNVVFEFDVTAAFSDPTAVVISAAQLNFTATPTDLSELSFASFNLATYGGQRSGGSLTLAIEDFSPIFEDADFFNSGNFSVQQNYSLDVFQSSGGNVGPAVGPDTGPSYRFITTSAPFPPPDSPPNSAIQFTNAELVLTYSESAAIPEPSTCLLTGLGLVLGIIRRKKTPPIQPH